MRRGGSGTEKKPDGQSSGQKPSEVCRQSGRYRVSGADNARSAKVDGDGIEGCFGAAHHHGGHAADIAVRPVGCHQVAGNGQCAAAGYGADQHEGSGFRRNSQSLQQGGAQRCQQIHGPGGPEHTDRCEKPHQSRDDVQEDGQAILGAAGQSLVEIDPLSHAAGGDNGQQERQDQGAEIHRWPLFRRERKRAVSRPTVTEARELTHTAGRMSKGAALP